MKIITVTVFLICTISICLADETKEKHVDAKEEFKKRHHEDDKINEKITNYIKLLDKKKRAIDKFLKDNYSDFNHTDYTPEVS